MDSTALIERLGLRPHPEGGHYREVFRSAMRVQVPDHGTERSALTVIHYLLCAGEFSRWHRVRAEEVWHHADGGPLELLLLTPDMAVPRRVTLGALADGHQPMVVVPADHWQAARPLGAHALCSCLVAPGFEFADFAFMDAAQRERLASLQPQLVDLC
jgi:predicted cupin superfamily sugar epimerase